MIFKIHDFQDCFPKFHGNEHLITISTRNSFPDADEADDADEVVEMIEMQEKILQMYFDLREKRI